MPKHSKIQGKSQKTKFIRNQRQNDRITKKRNPFK